MAEEGVWSWFTRLRCSVVWVDMAHPVLFYSHSTTRPLLCQPPLVTNSLVRSIMHAATWAPVETNLVCLSEVARLVAVPGRWLNSETPPTFGNNVGSRFTLSKNLGLYSHGGFLNRIILQMVCGIPIDSGPRKVSNTNNKFLIIQPCPPKLWMSGLQLLQRAICKSHSFQSICSFLSLPVTSSEITAPCHDLGYWNYLFSYGLSSMFRSAVAHVLYTNIHDAHPKIPFRM